MRVRPSRENNAEFFNSSVLRSRTFYKYLNMLQNLAVSRYKYENMPETCNVRYLEMKLLFEAQALFCRDDITGDILSLGVLPAGKYSVYGNPSRRTGIGYNGYKIPCDYTNSVIVYDNPVHAPTWGDIELYAYRLTNIARTIDINLNGQKTPITVLCDENQRLSYKNMLMKYEGEQYFIYGSKNLDPNNVQVLNTGAPYIIDKLRAEFKALFNEALGFLGIDANFGDKRERQIETETISSLGFSVSQRVVGLTERQRAIEKVNNMFGTNINVSFNDSMMLASQYYLQAMDFNEPDRPDGGEVVTE